MRSLLTYTFVFLMALAPLNMICAQDITVTGQPVSINGVTEVPKGLFGVHNMPLNDENVDDWGIESIRQIFWGPHAPVKIEGVTVKTNKKGKKRYSGVPKAIELVVECLYDRYQPALQLSKPTDWENYLREAARNYAKKSKNTGQIHHVEFWNEPYLNWATKPAVNYHQRWFDKDNIKAGEPMTIKGNVVDENLVWDKQRFYAYRDGRHIDYVATSKIPAWGKEGENVKLTGAPGHVVLNDGGQVKINNRNFILKKEWVGKDKTQKYYWSSNVNLKLYLEMLDVYGRELKRVNPDIQLAAGWGFNIFGNGWASWRTLIKPTIDASHEYIDAIHEHHYGGDTRVVASSYEVAWSYTMGTYGKSLKFWNTEAGGHLDPEQPGNVKPFNDGGPKQKAIGAMTYFIKDVSYLIAYVPDKAFARAAHHPHHNGGDIWAFRFMKPLRGQLIEASSKVPNTWVNASVNESNQLVVLVFNNNRGPRELAFSINAPEGTNFKSAQRAWIDTIGERLSIKTKGLSVSGDSWNGSVKVEKQSAVRIVFDLQGRSDFKMPLLREQFPSPDVLGKLYGEGGKAYNIKVPAEKVKKIKRAWLRTVTWGCQGKYTLSLNGKPMEINFQTSNIQDHAIDAELLKADNRLQFPEYPSTSAYMQAISLIVEYE